MEYRNVNPEYREENGQQVSSEEFAPGVSLGTENLHQLIDFFLLLDRWERELVQNDIDRDEVSVCRTQ